MSGGDHGWDAVSVGEVMLRFDPGEGRIRSARTFTVCEGGGEYNVVRALRACFDRPTAAVTALVDKEVESVRHRDLPVLDRVGSGDAFAADLLDGLLADAEPQHAIDAGAAAAVLATTTPGDTLIATRSDVEALASGEAPELRR